MKININDGPGYCEKENWAISLRKLDLTKYCQ